MAVRSIVTHLDATKNLLALVTPEMRAKCSEVQAQAVLKLLAAAGPLQVTDLAALQRAVMDTRFERKDEELLQEQVSKMVCATPDKGGKNQDFVDFVDMMPAHVWADLTENKGNAERALFEWLSSAGLRNPTEPTSQLIAIVLMLTADGTDRTLAFSPETRTTCYKQVKQKFHKYVKGLPAPPEDVRALRLHNFETLYPATYKQARRLPNHARRERIHSRARDPEPDATGPRPGVHSSGAVLSLGLPGRGHGVYRSLHCARRTRAAKASRARSTGQRSGPCRARTTHRCAARNADRSRRSSRWRREGAAEKPSSRGPI